MKLIRPEPPSDLAADLFVPAPALAEWVRRAFLEPEGPFYTDEHDHLAEARLVFSWTTARGKVRGRFIAGECQLAKPRGKQWGKQREAALFREWWRQMPDYAKGIEEPDFTITLYSQFCAAAAEASFGALSDHELFHAGQAVDGYGTPRRSEADGRPVWDLRGHDVEQFVAVIRRWGVGADPDAERLVQAARQKPEVAAAKIQEGMCGTCKRAVA